jgi:hypothetical protein
LYFTYTSLFFGEYFLGNNMNTALLFLTMCISHPNFLVSQVVAEKGVEEVDARDAVATACGEALIQSGSLGLSVQIIPKDLKNL